MPEHEPLDIASKDAERSTKAEARAARAEGATPAGKDASTRQPATEASDATAAASEPMELQRLPESSTSTPPGRQRTGDPPASKSPEQ